MLDQPLEDLGQLVLDDGLEVFLGERLEDDHIVDAVEEFGPEVALDLLVEDVLHFVKVGLGRLLAEAEPGLVLDQLGADVAGHDEDDVLEVDAAAEAVGEAAFVHDLKQHVVDVGMRLLDFVEQEHGVGAPPDAFGQLPALLVADVSWRGTDQTADVVFFHELAHVEPDQGVAIAEEELGQRLGQKRFADAAGAEEDETAHGPVRVLHATAAAADGLGHGGDRFVLRNDRAVQLGFKLQQALGFLLLEPGQGHAGHIADDLSDDLGIHHAGRFFVLFVPLLVELGLLLEELLGFIPEGSGPLVVGTADGFVFFALEPLDLGLDLGQVRWRRHVLETDAGPGFIDDVDGLVRQAAAGDVACGELDGLEEGLVGEAHAVVGFVAILEAA